MNCDQSGILIGFNMQKYAVNLKKSAKVTDTQCAIFWAHCNCIRPLLQNLKCVLQKNFQKWLRQMLAEVNYIELQIFFEIQNFRS